MHFIDSTKDIFRLIKTHHQVDRQFCLITDHNLFSLYEKDLKESFSEYFDASSLHTFLLSPGEASKTLEHYEKALNFMFKSGFSRSDVILAFGGGLITDFAGFVGATFMRGMKFYSIPTSILGMCDASIGSKTGINNDFGKN